MFVNLTNRIIRILQPNNVRGKDSSFLIEIEPCGRIAEIHECQAHPNNGYLGCVDNIPVFSAPQFQGVMGLPDPQPGVYYLVSPSLIDKVGERADVFCPDNGPTASRYHDGTIDYVTRLIMC